MSIKKNPVTIDPFQIRDAKLKTEEVIFRHLFAIFPNHRIALPTHPYRNYYTTWVYSDGEPLRQYTSDEDIARTQFGVIGPIPADNHTRFTWIPLVFQSQADLVADFTILYDNCKKPIQKLSITVFGRKNKQRFVDLAKKLTKLKIAKNITIKVKTEEPLQENVDYRTF